METIVIFSTKYGTSKKIAEHLCEQIKKPILISIDENEPNVEAFKNIIICMPIYAGKLPKPMTQFISENKELLGAKNTYICISAAFISEFSKVIQKDLPKEIVDEVKKILFVGGEISEYKLNLKDKLLFKLIKKQMAGLLPLKIDYEKLEKVIENINSNESSGTE